MSRATLWRKERRARGMCAVAGCPEETGEHAYRCERHAAAHRERMKERYQAARAAELATARAPAPERAA